MKLERGIKPNQTFLCSYIFPSDPSPQDFLPSTHQASAWAEARTELLGVWIMGISWGALQYRDPNVQMKMMKQFEDVVSSQYVTDMDTEDLWIASFNLWTTSQCGTSKNAHEFTGGHCGIDHVYPQDGSTCTGTWKRNKFGLRTTTSDNTEGQDSCAVSKPKRGVCRPTSDLHPDDLKGKGVVAHNDIWCPVFEGWSDEKLSFCLGKWGGGGLPIREHGQVKVPIPFSTGPSLTGFNMTSHDKTMEMIRETRSDCDDNADVHCWMTGNFVSYLWDCFFLKAAKSLTLFDFFAFLIVLIRPPF